MIVSATIPNGVLQIYSELLCQLQQDLIDEKISLNAFRLQRIRLDERLKLTMKTIQEMDILLWEHGEA